MKRQKSDKFGQLDVVITLAPFLIDDEVGKPMDPNPREIRIPFYSFWAAQLCVNAIIDNIRVEYRPDDFEDYQNRSLV